MHYIESGVGPPLVLLHAFPVDARMWNGPRALLEQHARVITPDQRGLGESPLDGSPARPLAEPTATEQVADRPDLADVAADVVALLDVLDIPRAVIGGCSMGGYAAMAMLRAAPDRVAGLLLVDTKAEADGEAQRENRHEVAERAERQGVTGWLAETMLPNLLGSTTRKRNSAVVERARSLIDEQPPAGIAWAQRALAARPDNSEVLRGFDRPALVVVGEQDTLSPPEAARDLAALLPNSELVTVPEAGHLVPLEAPEAFADAVRPWLRHFD